jgi:dTMP kinase
VYSNIAFQCAKLTNKDKKAALVEWIFELEFGYYRIPMPDLSLFLDVPTTATAEAMTSDRVRESRDYLRGEQDIHEADLDFQSRVHREYLNLTQSQENFHLIRCTDNDGNRSTPMQTHSLILQKLNTLSIL